MICRIAIAILLSFCFVSLSGAETFVYVSVAGDKRIAIYHLDALTGKLTHKADCNVADGEPGALTVDPDKGLLLAAIRSTGKLASFRLDPATGKLTHVNTVTVGPDPAHISTDRTGRYLLTAYYVDAKVTVHTIGTDGRLSEKPIQSIPTADKAHAIVPDPSNRFVFVPHTGPNTIFQFTFDAKHANYRPTRPRSSRRRRTRGRAISYFIRPSRSLMVITNKAVASPRMPSMRRPARSRHCKRCQRCQRISKAQMRVRR